jgi:hypothetical protein
MTRHDKELGAMQEEIKRTTKGPRR